jgi:endonuclease-3 related protein
MGIYRRLYDAFGPQHWWPGQNALEVAVGAILTQNTNWENVRKAIGNLKREGALSVRGIHRMPVERLSELIRPSGYFNVKAGRLKEFVRFLVYNYGGSLKRMGKEDLSALRGKLLGVKGVGPETADSIILYALGKPVFVVDAYTRRILSRHGIMAHEEPYERFQGLFHASLPVDTGLYNEYHALIVMTGKTFCRPSKHLCEPCPLRDV